MQTQIEQDSSLQLDFVPLSETGELAELRNFDSSSDINPPDNLPVFDILSDAPLPSLPDPNDHRAGLAAPRETAPATTFADEAPSIDSSAPRGPGAFWLEGDVVMCGCPDCAAPMSVRLWLMIADCWQCGTSIELTEQQEREVQRLLQQREKQNRVTPVAATPTPRTPAKTEERKSPDTQKTQPAARFRNEPPRQRPAQQPTPTQQPQRRRASEASVGARARIRQIARTGGASVWLTDVFRMTPAWLVSAVIHFVALMLLALFTMPRKDKSDDLTIVASEMNLSTEVSNKDEEGGSIEITDPDHEIQFDLPLPGAADLDDEETREAMIRADQDARELRLDPDEPHPNMPDIHRVKQVIENEKGPRRALAARDPRVRVEMVKKEGGTTLSEAAVARGLRWIAMHQNSDGSWCLHKSPAGCSCGGHGQRNDSAATSLALLPFLGAGQTHLTGRYKDVVAKGLRFMIDNQAENGYLTARSGDNPLMYAHGQGTIVLCEAYAMEGDEQLRDAAQRAVDFVVAAQHSGGGWRYSPGQAGDTSVVGWQLMALQSARAAGLHVPQKTLDLASDYLDSCGRDENSKYGYQPRRAPTEVMTAEALLCRMYLGWTRDEVGLRLGADWLAENYPPSVKRRNMYYWYYATQTMHHIGGGQWREWNNEMRDILVNLQEKKGHAAGSWSPNGFQHGGAGGRLYVTALAVCTLEVYYRHLPIFKQIDLDLE